MELNGLPLHALAVHSAVVFGPLSTLAGLAYALVPRWRDRLRWPFAATVAIALVAIWVAFLSGESVEENNDFFREGEVGELVEKHEGYADTLRLLTTGYALVGFVAAWWHTRTGPVRVGLLALVVLLGVGTGVWTVLTGDAGAQIAWSGIEG
jgi:hypothetical protein